MKYTVTPYRALACGTTPPSGTDAVLPGYAHAAYAALPTNAEAQGSVLRLSRNTSVPVNKGPSTTLYRMRVRLFSGPVALFANEKRDFGQRIHSRHPPAFPPADEPQHRFVLVLALRDTTPVPLKLLTCVSSHIFCSFGAHTLQSTRVVSDHPASNAKPVVLFTSNKRDFGKHKDSSPLSPSGSSHCAGALVHDACAIDIVVMCILAYFLQLWHIFYCLGAQHTFLLPLPAL